MWKHRTCFANKNSSEWCIFYFFSNENIFFGKTWGENIRLLNVVARGYFISFIFFFFYLSFIFHLQTVLQLFSMTRQTSALSQDQNLTNKLTVVWLKITNCQAQGFMKQNLPYLSTYTEECSTPAYIWG